MNNAMIRGDIPPNRWSVCARLLSNAPSVPAAEISFESSTAIDVVEIIVWIVTTVIIIILSPVPGKSIYFLHSWPRPRIASGTCPAVNVHCSSRRRLKSTMIRSTVIFSWGRGRSRRSAKKTVEIFIRDYHRDRSRVRNHLNTTCVCAYTSLSPRFVNLEIQTRWFRMRVI